MFCSNDSIKTYDRATRQLIYKVNGKILCLRYTKVAMAKIRLRRGAFATMISAHPDPAAAAIGELPAITVMILRWPANSGCSNFWK